jgi:hypothetical protein
MRQNHERLAWMVLLLSFALCVILAVCVPLIIQWYVQSSYTGQLISLDVQEGTLLVTCPGTDVPIAVDKQQNDLCQGRENIQIAAGPSDQGLLNIRPRTAPTATLSSAQIYRSTSILLQKATTSRFPRLSTQPDYMVVRVDGGRVRMTVPPNLARAMLSQVLTPQALIQLSEGSTSVEVNNQETQVTVREGQAFVVALANKSSGVQLRQAERVVVPTGSGLMGVVPAERNLLAGHSDFRDALGGAWKPYTVEPQFPDESPGEVNLINAEGRQVVDFFREGKGHAETGIAQDINRDIRDFSSLQLHIVLRVLQQDVPVCGTLGTECPVMVRIEYVDEGGSTRSWQQGFYSLPDPNVPANPPFCVTCNPRNDHRSMTIGQWYSFDSENLIPILTSVGSAPVFLKSISIYASGHTYQSQVAEIELLGQE